MKPFKTSWGFLLSIPALFLITSCSKNVTEQQAKSGSDVEQLATITGPVCHWKIGMQMRNNAGGSYFWVGPVRTDVSMQTPFSGMNFSNTSLMEVTALGTNAVPNHAVAGEHLGVKSDVDDLTINGNPDPTRVNIGETLVFKLGSGVNNYVMRGCSVQMNGNGAGVGGTIGKAEFFRAGSKQGEQAIVNPSPNQNFGFIHEAPLNKMFDEIRFTATTGSFRINARNTNPSPLVAATEFYIIQNSGAYINQNSSPSNPVIVGYNNGVNVGTQPNNGVINAPGLAFNTPPSYLVISTDAPLGLQFSTGGARLASVTTGSLADVQSIDPTETITVVPGPDFGSQYFSGTEIRVNHQSGSAPLKIQFWMGQNQVGMDLLTSGVDAAYNRFYSKLPFDRMTVTGTGSAASIGRPGIALRMFRGCM